MKITHKIQMDLVRPNIPQVDMVQGDRNTRVLKIIPLEDGKPWSIPPHTSAIIRYQKPNGQYGIYDTLASGETAIVITNNEICATIAPDVLSGAGTAQVSVSLIYGIEELSTFSIILNIRPGLSNPEAIDTSGMSITGMLPAPDNAVVGQYLLVDKVDNNGNVIKVRSSELTQTSLGLSPYAFTLSDSMVCTASIHEIVSAHESGRAIWCVYKGAKYLLTHVSNGYLVFYAVANDLAEIISIDPNGNGSYSTIAMQSAPNSTEYYGIHVGDAPPEDENIQVWIDTDEEPEIPASGEGAASTDSDKQMDGRE